MLRSRRFFRYSSRLAVLLPLAVLGVACGDDLQDLGDGDAGGEAGARSEAGSGNDSASGNDSGGGNDGSSTGDGNGGGDGSTGDAGDASDGAVVVPPDTTVPTISTKSPDNGATGVSQNTDITIHFSETMACATLVAAGTITVTSGGLNVPGTVTCLDNTATFNPSGSLPLGGTYTVTLTNAGTDLAGNKVGAAMWSFMTDASPPLGPPRVLLGTAGNFVVLAKSEVTNVPTSAIVGNVGISPAAASFITAFSMTRVGTYWTSAQVTGKLFAADNDAPTPSNMTTAISNMETAYTDAAGRPAPPIGPFLDVGAGNIGGKTLVPGLYRWNSTVTIPDNLTLAGGPNDVWIFQITGDVMMAADKSIGFTGGGKAKNVFWQVAGLVDLGLGAHAEGIFLCSTKIVVGTGASVTGRLLAQTGVNLKKNAITQPAP
jgi:hypothetical protein